MFSPEEAATVTLSRRLMDGVSSGYNIQFKHKHTIIACNIKPFLSFAAPATVILETFTQGFAMRNAQRADEFVLTISMIFWCVLGRDAV